MSLYLLHDIKTKSLSCFRETTAVSFCTRLPGSWTRSRRIEFPPGLTSTLLSRRYTSCARCVSQTFHIQRTCTARQLSTSTSLQSGHNRWSKIKHDKAKVDATRNKQRSQLAKELSLASKDYGPDPNFNPRLATLIIAAKKVGFPKASIAAAIARGQGQSSSGAPLESVTIEFLHSPTGVAAMVDMLTDNKARAIHETRDLMKNHSAAATPVSYMFERRGMLSFDGRGKSEGSVLSEEALMDAALDAGALDVETFPNAEATETTATDSLSSGGLVYTEPSELEAVAETMAKSLGIRPERRELIWAPREDTMVESGDGLGWKQLSDLIESLEDDPAVVGVYVNAK